MKNISVCALKCRVFTVRDHDRTKVPEPTSQNDHVVLLRARCQSYQRGGSTAKKIGFRRLQKIIKKFTFC